jgi:hypothetical protein
MAIFDASFFNSKIYCVNDGIPDPETGCAACGENARSIYEQCRQTYYLKKQTELTATEQKENKVTVSITGLEEENASLKSELATQVNINNQMREEYSSYYNLTGLTVILIIFTSVIAGYLIHFFIKKN